MPSYCAIIIEVRPALENPVRNPTLPTIPIRLLLNAALVMVALSSARPASADVRVRVQESSWSIGRTPAQVEALVETSVKAKMRRVETAGAAAPAPGDSLSRSGKSVQIDRIDRDSSYYFRPGDGLFLPVSLGAARASNRRGVKAFLAAQASGTAPRDTLPPVRTTELGRRRTILGETCRGVVLELVFSYRDSALATAEQLTGVLSDTVWLAPPDSPLMELKKFEQDFARVTVSDSFLAVANAVQLTQVRGQGLVSVLQRAIKGLPGYPLESSFVNLLHGLPKGLNLGDVERRPDGAVVVQRTVRRAVALSGAPLADEQFEVPKDLKAVRSGRP